MRTRPLGRTGIQVSPYCLGTMMFGPYGNPDHDDCIRIIHQALDAGINCIDTADVYGGDGETERIVGKALRGRRDDIVLATKVNGPMGTDPNRRGNSRRWVPRHMTDERKLDAVEQLIPIAEQAGLSLTHLALAFAITHPAVTSAIIGPRTTAHLEDLLAGAGTTLDDDILDRIDEVVPPGVDLGSIDVSYAPPELTQPHVRRRRAADRAAADRA
ncbi:aldo/keto reductase [Dactylosporangium sp. NPDC000555]|uniref:aldo/keto reductase n=1 Tax=Dactylosporangium sp. NPDC000555 TaxID=3154260 RepID=UPI00332EDC9E